MAPGLWRRDEFKNFYDTNLDQWNEVMVKLWVLEQEIVNVVDTLNTTFLSMLLCKQIFMKVYIFIFLISLYLVTGTEHCCLLHC